MRTTLDIDDDVLATSKELARREGRTAGQVLSALARRALTRSSAGEVREPAPALGFRPFPARDRIVDNASIDRLRDEAGV